MNELDKNDMVSISIADYNKLIEVEHKLEKKQKHYMFDYDYNESSNTYFGFICDFILYSKQKIEKNANVEKHKKEHGNLNGFNSKKKVSILERITGIFS